MTRLDDAALARLRQSMREPDLSGTRYQLDGVAGTGGMGTVYVVRDTELGRRVALKVLDVQDPEVEARLRREAEVLARLEHPGIVPVHDVGRLGDGRGFYTMKLVQGERLDRYATRDLSLPERLRVFLRIAEAVAFAHAHGVLHRDLKPQNVMIGPFGEVLVLDWGLAKVLSDPAGPAGAAPQRPRAPGDTGDGAVLGTPGFMAPEQAAGESGTADVRAGVALVVGGALGILDGLTAWFTPEVRSQLLGIVIGSTVKGLIAGALIGLFARKAGRVLPTVIFGTVIGALLALGIALLQGSHYLEIILPGTLVGLLTGYATMRYGRPPTAAPATVR